MILQLRCFDSFTTSFLYTIKEAMIAILFAHFFLKERHGSMETTIICSSELNANIHSEQ